VITRARVGGVGLPHCRVREPLVKHYIAQRLGIGLVTLVGMSVVIFLLLRLAPGNIVDILFSTGGYVNPSERLAIERELGLDKPIWAQYLDWVRQLAVGNLGSPIGTICPAWEIIAPLIPVTLELAALSLIISVWPRRGRRG